MPIDRLANGLVVTNPLLGPIAMDAGLPDMSIELFDWLTAYHVALSAPDAVARKSLVDQIRSDNRLQYLRAHYSAHKMSNPPLAVGDRTLTPYGLDMAKTAHDVKVSASRAYYADPVLKVRSDNMTELEQSMVVCQIRYRAILLLKTIHEAIEEAKRRFIAGIDPQDLPPRPTKKMSLNEEHRADLDGYTEEVRKLLQNLDVGKVAHPGTHELEYVPDDIDVQLMRTPGPESQLIVYVPINSFGVGKARTDWRVLARYGFVDVKTITTGSRGRAKLALMPSDVGKLLLTSLDISSKTR